ncbi:response regulator [Streptococcus pneumoniae]|nr:response regulator [Streptococcus pneumoniae]
MRIFVLEDDFSQQTRIETTIEKLLKAHHIIPSSFEVFGKPDQLLAEVHEKGAHQLFFLDIEIRNEEMKGLEVARKIREKRPLCPNRLCDDSLGVYASVLSLPSVSFGLH